MGRGEKNTRGYHDDAAGNHFFWGDYLVQYRFQVFLRRGDGLDGEFINQNLQNWRRDECGNCWSEPHVFDAERKQGQENAHCLLFIP